MKRKILSILLCLGVSVSLLAGCGTKNTDAANDKVTDSSSAKVTKKLEEEYLERIDAYQEYYEQVRSDYSNYDAIGGMITLDSDGLPLLWLGLSQDGSDDNVRTQLIGYENDKAVILAERSEYIIPFRSSQLILAVGDTDGDEDNYYLYDDEKKDFRLINNELDGLYNNETVYSEEELEEKMDFLVPILEGLNFYKSIQIATNESARQIAYLGKKNIDVNYEALSYMDVTSNIYGESDNPVGCYLREEYADNKVALECFEKLPDANLDGISIEGFLNKHSAEIYNDIVKEANELFITATGTVLSVEEYENSVSIMEGTEWKISRGGFPNGSEYFTEAELGQLLRGLSNNPLYSEEELYLYIASIAFNYEIVDIDIESYTLLEASDGYIGEVVEDYIESRSYCERNFTDELINERDVILETEPYNTIRENRIDTCKYENNIATIEVEDSEETYQFQIEFTEAGDKISKITYIDPMSSMSEEDKQAYKVKTEVLPAYEKYVSDADRYSLVYIDDDEIPELITSTASWYNIYTYNGDVVDSGLAPNVLEFIEKANSIHITEGHGVFYDTIISIKNGMFESYAYGRHGDVYDDEGNYVPDAYEYYWDGRQVSESEYNDLLRSKFDYEKSKSIQNIEFYSTIQEAYDNIGNSHAVEVPEQEAVTETYHDMMYSCSEFELNNQRLLIDADSFNIDLEISDDCVWQTRYSDGSVYDSSYDDLHRSWENALDSKQKLDEMGREYESPEGLGVEVKDGKVVAVYMTAS